MAVNPELDQQMSALQVGSPNEQDVNAQAEPPVPAALPQEAEATPVVTQPAEDIVYSQDGREVDLGEPQPTPAELRALEISGVDPESAKTVPERVVAAQTQPIPLDAEQDQRVVDYYNRFGRIEDPRIEESNRQSIMNAKYFFVPKKVQGEDGVAKDYAKDFAESGFSLAPNAENSYALQFPAGVDTPEMRIAYMASQGAVGYSTPQEGLGAYDGLLQRPRYVQDAIKQAKTEKEDVIPLVLAERKIGGGKSEFSAIMTRMGIVNPADQVAIMAAEDAGLLASRSGFAEGVRSTINIFVDLYKWTNKQLGVVGELNLPAGGTTDTAAKMVKIIEETAIAEERIKNDPQNQGMFKVTIDPETGVETKELRSEFLFDYAGALEAQGFNKDGAQEFINYSWDATERAARLVGEEAIFMSASFVVRYGLSAIQARGFNRWINDTFGSFDDAIKQGYTGGKLAAEYIEQIGDSKLSGWARSMAANSMRIQADTGAKGVFSVSEQINAQATRLSELSTELKGLVRARTQARFGGKSTAEIDRKIRATRTQINRTSANLQSAQEEATRASWLGDTLRTNAYGITGAALAGQTMNNYFGGETTTAIAEVLGFVSGHTIVGLGVNSAKSLLKLTARGTDELINFGAVATRGVSLRPFEAAGAYSDIDRLSRTERRVLESLSGLRGQAKVSAINSARYMNGLRETLASIRTKDGDRIFEDQFLDETLGSVTALNVLQMAERQLERGIAVGDIKDMGEGFYAKEEIFAKKTEILVRLNQAVQELLPAGSSPEATQELKDFITGLRKYTDDTFNATKTHHEATIKELDNRQAVITAALNGSPEALDKLGVKVGEGIDPSSLVMQLQSVDDDLYLRSVKALGFEPEESLKMLNDRIDARTKDIEREATAALSAVTGGSTAQGGPATHGSKLFYTTRNGHYSKARAPYSALFERDEVQDNVLMSITDVYDFYKTDPNAFSPLDVPMTVSEGATDVAQQGTRAGIDKGFYKVFDDAANRTMSQFESKIVAQAQAAGKDPQEAITEFYTAVGVGPNAPALKRWEAVRAGLRQESTAEVNGYFLENFGKGSTERLALAEKMLPLAINVKEYHLLKSGVNAEVSASFRRSSTGAQAQGAMDLRDALSESARDPATGFQRGLFTKDRAPATDIYEELKAADKNFREVYAERYLRGGSAQQVGGDVPPQKIPDMNIARSTGRVRGSQFHKITLGQLASGTLQERSVALDVTNEAAQMFGVRIGDDVEGFARPDVVLKEGEKPPKGALTYIDSMGNEQTMPEGAFVFMAGDATTDAYKANLELFLVDHIRRSPAQAALRKLALDRQMGGLTDAQRQAVLQSDQIQDFDPNLLLNMDMMFMLKKGEDGRYYEAPLINVQKVLQEISYDTVYHVDPNVRRHSDKALEEWDRVANRMRSEAKRDQEQNETAYRLIDREFQSMDEGPRDFFTKQFEKGDAGSLDSNILRMKIIERAELEAVANGATEAEKLKAVEEATRIYDEARQRHFAAWVTSKTEGSIDGMKATRIDPATDGKGRAIPVKGFKGQELLRIMGADGGPYAEENAEMFRKLLDDDEHYEKLQAVAEWAITKQNRVPSGGQMEGVPTGLSIESWISRIYSINRGVVSPRYVGAEALIQSFRMQGLSLVEAMVTDPKLAARVEKILISGKPLPTEQENYELMQSLMTAGAMYLTRTEYAQETQEPIGSNIPIEISQPTSVEEQMQQVVPQIQEVTNQTGMTQ